MARALPASPDVDTVEFEVDPSTLWFETEAENQHRCSLRFEVQAFTREGKLVKVEVQTRRWVLKFDNPKVIEQIDAVFVTVEPKGGSDNPAESS